MKEKDHFKRINEQSFTDDIEKLMNDTVLVNGNEENASIVYECLTLLEKNLKHHFLKKKNWIREITDWL